jgi:cobalt-zinc-cadmium efflux system membrane fusion protein
MVAAALLSLAAAGCANAVEPQANAAEKGEKRDSIELDAGSPMHRFLKVETAGSAEPATVTLTGKVAFDENHTQRLASPIDGRATKVLVDLGDDVRQGQVLVHLSSPALGQLQSDVQKAQQDVTLTQRALERAKGLLASGAIPAKDVQQAESDHAKAKADLAAAQTRSEALNVSVAGGGAGLRAQVAGTVVDRAVLVGQEVRADQAQPLLVVSDLSTVWVVGDLFEQDLALAHPGADVEVTVAAYPGIKVPGKIALVSNVVDPATHTLKVRCVVPNPDRKLKPEMFARIMLHDAEAKQVSVPAKAILVDSQPPRVVVVEGDRFKLREVNVGPEVAGRVRVLSGLAAGERVVAEGAIFLKQEIESQ